MYQIVLPDGTVRIVQSKAEAYKLIAEIRENYEGYLS